MYTYKYILVSKILTRWRLGGGCGGGGNGRWLVLGVDDVKALTERVGERAAVAVDGVELRAEAHQTRVRHLVEANCSTNKRGSRSVSRA